MSENLVDLTFDVHYQSSAIDGSSVSIRAAFDGKGIVKWLYQLKTKPQPVNQFAGGHGFTGLVYLVNSNKPDDYQFLCEFSDL